MPYISVYDEMILPLLQIHGQDRTIYFPIDSGNCTNMQHFLQPNFKCGV